MNLKRKLLKWEIDSPELKKVRLEKFKKEMAIFRKGEEVRREDSKNKN